MLNAPLCIGFSFSGKSYKLPDFTLSIAGARQQATNYGNFWLYSSVQISQFSSLMFEINSKSFIVYVIHTFSKVKLFSRQKSRIETTAAVLAIQNGLKK